MKKKIFSIFLVMVLCIGMTAGCKKNVGTSQDNAIAEEDDDSKEEAKSYRFGFSCITMENPYYITQKNGNSIKPSRFVEELLGQRIK